MPICFKQREKLLCIVSVTLITLTFNKWIVLKSKKIASITKNLNSKHTPRLFVYKQASIFETTTFCLYKPDQFQDSLSTLSWWCHLGWPLQTQIVIYLHSWRWCHNRHLKLNVQFVVCLRSVYCTPNFEIPASDDVNRPFSVDCAKFDSLSILLLLFHVLLVFCYAQVLLLFLI